MVTATPGWLTLNTDDCLHRENTTSGGRGIVRDHTGNWIGGRSCSIKEAELWALIHGLRLAWEKGIRHLVAEIDSITVYTWIPKGVLTKNKHTSLIRECLEFSKRNWPLSIHHMSIEKGTAQQIFWSSSIER